MKKFRNIGIYQPKPNAIQVKELRTKTDILEAVEWLKALYGETYGSFTPVQDVKDPSKVALKIDPHEDESYLAHIGEGLVVDQSDNLSVMSLDILEREYNQTMVVDEAHFMRPLKNRPATSVTSTGKVYQTVRGNVIPYRFGTSKIVSFYHLTEDGRRTINKGVHHLMVDAWYGEPNKSVYFKIIDGDINNCNLNNIELIGVEKLAGEVSLIQVSHTVNVDSPQNHLKVKPNGL